MSDNESGNDNQEQQAAPAAPLETPTAAPKPTGPQNVIFKGNSDTTSIKATDDLKQKE